MAQPPIHLDRRVTESSTGVSVAFDGTKTTWTLPYEVPLDGSEGSLIVVRTDTREELTTTHETVTTVSSVGNYLGVGVTIGIAFRFGVQFSLVYPRRAETDVPDIRGRTVLRYLKVHYQDSTGFSVVVSSRGRELREYAFAAEDPNVPESGIFTVPVQSRNTDTTITIVSADPTAAWIAGYEWEGTLYTRVPRR